MESHITVQFVWVKYYETSTWVSTWSIFSSGIYLVFFLLLFSQGTKICANMLFKCYFGMTQKLILCTPSLLLVYQFQQLPECATD